MLNIVASGLSSGVNAQRLSMLVQRARNWTDAGPSWSARLFCGEDALSSWPAEIEEIETWVEGATLAPFDQMMRTAEVSSLPFMLIDAMDSGFCSNSLLWSTVGVIVVAGIHGDESLRRYAVLQECIHRRGFSLQFEDAAAAEAVFVRHAWMMYAVRDDAPMWECDVPSCFYDVCLLPRDCMHEPEEVIDAVQRQGNFDAFVETGFGTGHTAFRRYREYGQLFSIEILSKIVAWGRKEFALLNATHVQIIEGRSKDMLPSVLAQLRGPALFWLDAHYNLPLPDDVDDIETAAEVQLVLNHARTTGDLYIGRRHSNVGSLGMVAGLAHVMVMDDADQILNNHGWAPLHSLMCKVGSGWELQLARNLLVLSSVPLQL